MKDSRDLTREAAGLRGARATTRPSLVSMRNGVAGPVAALINEFSKLPTIGPKTAARLVFHLLNRPRGDAEALADAIIALKDRVRLCSRCFSITEEDPCAICGDPRRDARTVVRRGRG